MILARSWVATQRPLRPLRRAALAPFGARVLCPSSWRAVPPRARWATHQAQRLTEQRQRDGRSDPMSVTSRRTAQVLSPRGRVSARRDYLDTTGQMDEGVGKTWMAVADCTRQSAFSSQPSARRDLRCGIRMARNNRGSRPSLRPLATHLRRTLGRLGLLEGLDDYTSPAPSLGLVQAGVSLSNEILGIEVT